MLFVFLLELFHKLKNSVLSHCQIITNGTVRFITQGFKPVAGNYSVKVKKLFQYRVSITLPSQNDSPFLLICKKMKFKI